MGCYDEAWAPEAVRGAEATSTPRPGVREAATPDPDDAPLPPKPKKAKKGKKPMRHTIRGATSMVLSVTRRLAQDDSSDESWDMPELAELAALADAADVALQVGVDCLRRHGMTWEDISNELGVSRQAAHRRFGHKG